MTRTHTWYLIPLVIGGFFEWVGYIARVASSLQSPDYTLGPYTIQTILLLIAPALFAASIYMELGRIILLTYGEAHSVIRQKWFTKIFIAGDVLAFTTQAIGGGRMAMKSTSAISTGSHIVLGGLFIQIIFFGLFVTAALIFNLRINKNPTMCSRDVPWRKHLKALYAASLLIMVRSIFRVMEYTGGRDGYLLGHEVYMYIFDAVLMVAVMAIFNFVQPSEVNALLCGGRVASEFMVYEGSSSRLTGGDDYGRGDIRFIEEGPSC
ncbi:MAG: hypothetical protein M1834_008248 [Cirrosporium novae-zelandiae]|nr:MAG: hypothetical protein M1834_008248 [Cirrosporium novae-zelandiae]